MSYPLPSSCSGQAVVRPRPRAAGRTAQRILRGVAGRGLQEQHRQAQRQVPQGDLGGLRFSRNRLPFHPSGRSVSLFSSTGCMLSCLSISSLLPSGGRSTSQWQAVYREYDDGERILVGRSNLLNVSKLFVTINRNSSVKSLADHLFSSGDRLPPVTEWLQAGAHCGLPICRQQALRRPEWPQRHSHS